MKNTRREFLSGLSKVAGGTVLGYVTLPILAGCVPTSIPLEPEQTSTPIGPDGKVSVDVSSLSQGSPSLVAPNILGLDGFPVMVTLLTDGTVHAFSMRCTHQGCTVDSQLEHDDIHCSCHDSLFALDGSVIQGPATVPLTAYPVTYDAAGHIATIKLA
ncbi:MAG TPA: Rieske 2Fe-2S domain-containing protein [Candidatus Kapabacteria bacterium]|jgi:Rieske Fe-S protein